MNRPGGLGETIQEIRLKGKAFLPEEIDGGIVFYLPKTFRGAIGPQIKISMVINSIPRQKSTRYKDSVAFEFGPVKIVLKILELDKGANFGYSKAFSVECYFEEETEMVEKWITGFFEILQGVGIIEGEKR
ncbi:MAG: hypothetical protein WCT36_02230 [Candidatus Gracilibacteria bacterium]